MLLRTSSAPVLSACLHGELAREFDFLPAILNLHEPIKDSHINSGSNGISSASPVPKQHRSSSMDPHGCSSEETHGDADWISSCSTGKCLSRAQSEGDLASIRTGLYAGWSFLSTVADDENQESSESPIYGDNEETVCNNVEQVPQLETGERKVDFGFVSASWISAESNRSYEMQLNDGEVYTSMEIVANGGLAFCNSKGCRPVTENEMHKIGPSAMVGVSGSDGGRGSRHGGSNGWKDDGGLGWTDRDEYYQRLLKDDPNNPLLLRNYAHYLLEEKHDVKKSEEFFERAILSSPGDGEVLSQYAKLQWDIHRDQHRAESYFDQAIQAAPDDCYVTGSYASFLWDAEEEETTTSAPTSAYAVGSIPSPPVVASA